MRLLKFSAATALVFLLGDFFVIPLVMRPLFSAALGDTMLQELRLFPAALFYIIHVLGIIWFAGRPYMHDNNRLMAGANGLMVGVIAYSCYEMTSWTIMRDWTSQLVIIDLAWGTAISGISAFCGALVSGARKT
ncbi:MAG: DUF2177 family protein [Rhizobiaceae bacterium]